jgi:5-methylcytosine-specific restriction endonuclease McrA
MEKTKRCPRCREVKSFSGFSRSRKRYDVLASWCKACNSAYAQNRADDLKNYRRRYYEQNKEKLKADARAYREKHLERHNTYQKQYYRENADVLKAKVRQYQANRREEVRAKNRRWRSNNLGYVRERLRAWHLANPDKKKAAEHRRRAWKMGNGGHFTAAEWQALKRQYNYTCLRCGRCEPKIKLTPDHVIPLARGGRNDISNIQPLCGPCNSSKNTATTDYRSRPYPVVTQTEMFVYQDERLDVKPSIVETPTNPLIACLYGCGSTLAKYDKRGRERQFLPSHGSHFKNKLRKMVTCEWCARHFERPLWHIRKVKHQFCNQRCAGAWTAANGTKRGTNNGHYNTLTVPCSSCGTPVSKARSLIERRNNRVYCTKCVALVRQNQKRSPPSYPKAFSAALRQQIRRRDNYTCQICGRHQDEAGTLHVHHIDYDKTHNDPMNLIALCSSCHGQTNFGMEAWRERLTAMLRKRFLV